MILGWIVLPVIGLLYLRFGYVPVAVNGPVIPFEALLAGTAVQARIARDAPTKAAIPAERRESARRGEDLSRAVRRVPRTAWRRRLRRFPKACTRRRRSFSITK